MHSSEDGWMHSCTSNVGWGLPIRGKRWGRPPRPHFSTEQELDDRGHQIRRADDGNIISD
eukprot:3500378-Karenia_brevis.AAC.1